MQAETLEPPACNHCGAPLQWMVPPTPEEVSQTDVPLEETERIELDASIPSIDGAAQLDIPAPKQMPSQDRATRQVESVAAEPDASDPPSLLKKSIPEMPVPSPPGANKSESSKSPKPSAIHDAVDTKPTAIPLNIGPADVGLESVQDQGVYQGDENLWASRGAILALVASIGIGAASALLVRILIA